MFVVLFGVAVCVLIVCIILAFIATIGTLNLTDGCFTRYSPNDNNSTAYDTIVSSVKLKANGNYKVISTVDNTGKSVLVEDHNAYGSWMNSNLVVNGGSNIKINVEGEVSLCRAYLPANNLASNSNVDKDNNLIPIPRVEEATGLPLIFSAASGQWANITNVYRNDRVRVTLGKDGANSAFNIFTGETVSDSCVNNKVNYSPICGRYSPYNGNQYEARCQYKCSTRFWCACNDGGYKGEGTCNNNGKCGFLGLGERYNKVDVNVTLGPGLDIAPSPYYGQDSIIDPVSLIQDIAINNHISCTVGPVNMWYMGESEYHFPDGSVVNQNSTYPPGEVINVCNNFPARFPAEYQNDDKILQPPTPRLWCSADNACGVLYRFDSGSSDNVGLGSDYNFATLNDTNAILDSVYAQGDNGYLQYRYYDKSIVSPNNTGGYVFYLKHTKCRRQNGAAYNDPSFNDRGRVVYAILPADIDPNLSDISNAVRGLVFDENSNANITVPSNIGKGSLWFKINNKPEDYADSAGQYNLQLSTAQKVEQFTIQIMTPLLNKMRSMVRSSFETVFKNMTCYGDGSNLLPACSNFFNYLKGMLSLYIMIYGMMFLLGMVQISQQDLVIRVIKIAIVSGLMNDQTYNWFSTYVFVIVTNFADEMIANISGYSIATSAEGISNPFMFLDEVMTRIFFTKTFIGQLFALISMGLSGMLYFVIVLIAIIIMVIAVFKAIATYVVAFLLLAVLMGLAPLFLSFMLFNFTRHLFDNWVKFTFRYMVEPVILIAGLIILTQLFTIYLDYVLGYSVCWKCTLALKIPFPNIAGFTPAFANVPLFCLNWFAPWGFDNSSGMMALNMQHIISLLIIAYTMYGYSTLSGKMVEKLTRAGGASATKVGDNTASAASEQVLSRVGLEKEKREAFKNHVKDKIKEKLMGKRGKAK